MRPIFARRLLHQEREKLEARLHYPVETLAKRAAIVWLSSEERYRAPEIAELVGMHANSIRYWIHRFNKEGMTTLRPCESLHWGSRVDSNVRATLIQLATTPPREMGLKFTTWTLRNLKEYLIEQEVIEEISHETIRRILKEENINWKASGSLLKGSLTPDLLGSSMSLEPAEWE
jgi:transposase